MKNIVTILIIFLSFVQTANAQSNFGKRKFSRSLFSNNIHFKSKKEQIQPSNPKKSKAHELVLTKDLDEETESIELPDTVSIESKEITESLIDTIVIDAIATKVIDVEEEIKSNAVEKTKVNSKPSFVSSFSSKKVNQTFNLESKVFMMSANGKQKFNKQLREDRLFDFDWDEILGWLFTAALCVGYLLLLHYFPVIAAIVTIVGGIVLIIVLINGFFNLLGDIFSGIFG